MPESLQNIFMNAFSLKMLLVCALLFLITAIPTWVLVRWSKNFASAYTHDKLPYGVGGWLILFLFGQVAWFLRGVWETCYLSGELLYVLQKSPGTLQSILVAVLPTFFALIFGAIVIYQIVVKRSASAIATTIVLIWIMGPGVAMLQSWYFDRALAEISLIELFGWAIVWSLYFAVSRRVALTYGTVRGKNLSQTGNIN